MSEPENSETTAGGLIGKVVGKVKETAGKLAGQDELAREGRLQQIQVDAAQQADRKAADARRSDAEAQLHEEKAQVETERHELQNQIIQNQREEQIASDRQRAERQARQSAEEQKQQAARERDAQLSAADAVQRSAEDERVAAATRAAGLEQEARRAENIADSIDPEEDQ